MAKKFSQVERVVAQQIIDTLQARINAYFGKDDKVGEVLTRKISLYKRDTFRILLNINTLKYVFEKEDMLVDLGRSAYSQQEIKNIQQQVNVYINGWISQWVIFKKHNPEVPVDNLTAKRSKVFPWIEYDEDNWNKFQGYLTAMYSEASKIYAESCVYHFLTEEEAAAARASFPTVVFDDPEDILSDLRTDIISRLEKTEETMTINSDFLDISLRHIINGIRDNDPTLNYEYREYPEKQRRSIKDKHGQFIDYCYDQVLADKGYIYGRDNENIGTAIAEEDIPSVPDFEDLLTTRATTEAYSGLYTEVTGNHGTHTYGPTDLESVIAKNRQLIQDDIIPDFVKKIEDGGETPDYIGSKGKVQGIRIPGSEELTGLRDALFNAASKIAIGAINTTKSLGLEDLQGFHTGLVRTSEEYQKENGNIDSSFIHPIISAAEGYLGDIIVKAITAGIYNEAYLSGELDTDGSGNIYKLKTTGTSMEDLVLQPNRIITTTPRDTTVPKKDYIIRKVKTTGNKVLVNSNGKRKILPVLTTKSPEFHDISVQAVSTTSPLTPLEKLVIQYKIKTAKDWVQYITDVKYRPVSTTTTPTVDFSSSSRVKTTEDYDGTQEIDQVGRVITTATPPDVEILSVAPIQTTTPVKNKHLVLDGSPTSAFTATYNTFSGTDMVVSVNVRLDENNTINKIIGSFQTISYSIFNDKAPVRVLGDMNPRRFVFGPRLIAGSIVMTVFDKHWMRELLGTYVRIKSATEKYFLLDELPEMNITISMANEYGQAARLALYGVTFIKEGQIMSVNDIYTENTCQFYARNIDYMDSLERAVKRNKRTDIIPVRIVSVQEAGKETIAVNPPGTGTSTTGTTVVNTTDPPKKSTGGGATSAPPRTVGSSKYMAIKYKVNIQEKGYKTKREIDKAIDAAKDEYIQERKDDLRDITDSAQKLLLRKYNIKETKVMTNKKLDETKIQKLQKGWNPDKHNGLTFESYLSEYRGTENTYEEECTAIELDEKNVAENIKEECYYLLEHPGTLEEEASETFVYPAGSEVTIIDVFPGNENTETAIYTNLVGDDISISVKTNSGTVTGTGTVTKVFNNRLYVTVGNTVFVVQKDTDNNTYVAVGTYNSADETELYVSYGGIIINDFEG